PTPTQTLSSSSYGIQTQTQTTTGTTTAEECVVAVPALVSDSPVYVNDSVIFFESGVITGQLFGSFQSPILRLIQKQPTSCENQQPNGTVTICMWVDSEHSESDYVLVAAEDLQDLQECSNSVKVVDDQ